MNSEKMEIAIRSDNQKELVKLLDSGVDPNGRIYLGNETFRPIEYAIMAHNAEIVEILISRGAEVNTIWRYAREETSPLSHARKIRNREIEEILIKANAKTIEELTKERDAVECYFVEHDVSVEWYSHRVAERW